ncbi:hypothetical protein GCM10017788_64870 [Amycolatopsis acidiphila]|nr:hypothetical protein GCM10017788_64870 [Amycolatopsis acidiphila]
MRQRRLRDVQPVRCLPEVALLGDGDEVPQVPQLHLDLTFDAGAHRGLSFAANDCAVWYSGHSPPVDDPVHLLNQAGPQGEECHFG